MPTSEQFSLDLQFRHLYSLASSASAAYAVDQQEILKVLARILRKVEDKHVMAIVAGIKKT